MGPLELNRYPLHAYSLQQAKHRPLPDHYVASQFAACTRTCVFEGCLAQKFAQSSIMVRRRSSASERLYAASTLLSNVCAKAASARSDGYEVQSPTQSRKVDLKPCGTAATSIRRITAKSVISDRGCPLVPGKSKLLPSTLGNVLSNSSAALGNAIRCSLPAFIRSAGIVQIPLSRS